MDRGMNELKDLLWKFIREKNEGKTNLRDHFSSFTNLCGIRFM